jgi:hypothetical protein
MHKKIVLNMFNALKGEKIREEVAASVDAKKTIE